MRAFIATLCLAIFGVGCHSIPTTQSADIELWHSPYTSAKQREQAASRLVPKGTKQVDAELILGQPARRERFHGPVVYFPGYEGPTNVTYIDVWHDLYDFADGDYVCLAFDIDASRAKWEDRPLLSVSSGNTNQDALYLFPIVPLEKK